MKTDLLTNATVVDDAIRFVSSNKSKEKQKSSLDNSNQDDKNSSSGRISWYIYRSVIPFIHRVAGTMGEYSNKFGATLTAAIINANSVEKIDCINAINPAKKTVFVKEIQVKGGISLFLDKIEFSDKNTRAYLNISSNSNNYDEVHFYDSQSKAVQGNRQFGTTDSFGVDVAPYVEIDRTRNLSLALT
jgi:hypothetical protein